MSTLRAALTELGGELASSLASAGAPGSPYPALAASGPRAGGHADALELLLAMIHEGSELHYGTPAELRPADPDLALLLGDQLYAQGLLRLAEIGDLAAVVELADLISLEAQAVATGHPEWRHAIWQASARAIGWGTNPEHTAAKQALRGGDEQALGHLSDIPPQLAEPSMSVTSAERSSPSR